MEVALNSCRKKVMQAFIWKSFCSFLLAAALLTGGGLSGARGAVELPNLGATPGAPGDMQIIRDALGVTWKNVIADLHPYSVKAFNSQIQPGKIIAGVILIAHSIRPNKGSFTEGGVEWWDISPDGSDGATQLTIDGGLTRLLNIPEGTSEPPVGVARLAMTRLRLQASSHTDDYVSAIYTFSVKVYVPAGATGNNPLLILSQKDFEVRLRLRAAEGATILTESGVNTGTPVLAPIDFSYSRLSEREIVSSSVPEPAVRPWIYGRDTTFGVEPWSLEYRGATYGAGTPKRLEDWNRAWKNSSDYVEDVVTGFEPLGYTLFSIAGAGGLPVAPFFANASPQAGVYEILPMEPSALPAYVQSRSGNQAGGDLRFSFHASPDEYTPVVSTSPTLEVSPDVETGEKVRKAFIPVEINPATVGPVKVRLEAIPGSATLITDYAVRPVEFKIARGKTRVYLPVPVVNDRESEGDETFRIKVSIVSGFAQRGNYDTATVTIHDDDQGLKPPAFVKQPVDAYVAKEGGSAVFAPVVAGAKRYQWYRNGVPIPKATRARYSARKVTLEENDAAFFVEASNDAGTVRSHSVRVQVGPEITFLRSAVAVDESAGEVPFEILVRPAPKKAFVIDLSVVAGGTTSSGEDFTVSPNVTIPAKETHAAGRVQIFDDTISEGDEFFTLRASASGARAVVQRWVILDNDTPPNTVVAPVFSPAGGTFPGPVDVSLSTATSGAAIRYTTNGSDPTASSTLYTGAALHFTGPTTLKARAFKSGLNDSSVTTATYTIPPQAAAPVFNPSTETYTGSVDVTISTATSGATLRYTTDGSDPTSSSALYTGTLTFTSTTTLKARAFASGYTASPVTTATYTITAGPVAPPAFSPAAGSFVGSVNITLSTATSGATIRYTTDGSNPTGSSPIYAGPLNLTSTTTVKARASKAGYTDSAVVSATYTLVTPTVVASAGPVEGIGAAADSETYYRITVPAGQRQLTVKTSGGTGDCDLYVKLGTVPTTGSYDYRGYNGGNTESVVIANPAAGTWYIMLHGYEAFSGVTLEVSITGPGYLDPNINPNASETVYATAVQPDGKILVAGGFASLGGDDTRSYLVRLRADGTLDADFNPAANGTVYCVAVQADGKIVIGGTFSAVGGATRNRLARLNADGTLDPFNPNPNNAVRCLALQANGRLLVGGDFTTIGIPAAARNRVARFDLAGTSPNAPDSGFSPSVNGPVYAIAVQPGSGKIVVGGEFSSVTTTGTAYPRNNLARLDADGPVDVAFNPDVNNTVYAMAAQTDGLLFGGGFSTVSGTERRGIARLNAAGGLDGNFNPNANNTVYSIATQADGKILVGGAFSSIGAASRSRIARLQADITGTADPGFNPNASSTVRTISVREAGDVFFGGQFTTVGGVARNRVAQVFNETAAETFVFSGSTRVQWLRTGALPETQQPSFDLTTDAGVTWTSFGAGSRIAGGFEVTGLSLPAVGQIRGRARIADGSPGTGLMESLANFGPPRGETWTPVTSNTGNELRGLVRNGSRFVAVGAGGTIITSTTGATGTWTAQTSGVSADLYGATVTDTGAVYAVGANGTLLYSSAGISWVTRNSGVTSALLAIAHDARMSNIHYVAVGTDGVIRTSPDGITWTGRTSGTTGNIRSVSCDGERWCVVGDDGYLRTSTDGVTWTARTSRTTSGLFAVIDNRIAVGSSGRIITSSDGGLTWIVRSSGTTAQLRGLSRTENSCLAVGASAVILTSQDGIDWTQIDSSTSSQLYGVAYDPVNRRAVAVGQAGTVLLSQ